MMFFWICRTMGKSLDHHSVQILNISRFQQKLRAEEALAKLNQVIFWTPVYHY